MNWLILLLIDFYKRFISPHKGFSCAYRRYHGGDSCSSAVRKIIQTDGCYRGARKIKQQFRLCKVAAQALNEQRQASTRNHNADLDCGLSSGCGAGDCVPDFGCFDGGSGGEGGGSHCGDVLVEAISCFDFSNDNGKKKKRRRQIGFSALAILLIAGSAAFYYKMTMPPKIVGVDIRLKENAEEEQEGFLAKYTHRGRLDYQLILTINGREYHTNKINNTTANEWLAFQLPEEVRAEFITQIRVIDFDIINSNVLEDIYPEADQGEGRKYQYVIRKSD